MRRLIRWLRSWSRARRYKAREIDARVLFVQIWFQCGRDPGRFIEAATLHTSLDPNWRGHEDEWQLTPIEPGTWAAMRMSAEGSRV
jgi:hypothetical protein